MTEQEYNEIIDNLRGLQNEADIIESKYNALMNANLVDQEHINNLYNQFTSIKSKAKEEKLLAEQNITNEDMLEQISDEYNKIINHDINKKLKSEKAFIDQKVGIKFENGKYSLNLLPDQREKLDKKHKYEAEVKIQQEEIKKIEERLKTETDDLIKQNLQNEISTKKANVEAYKKEIKRLGHEIVEERRKAKSLYDEDVKITTDALGNTVYTKTHFDPYVEEMFNGKTIRPLRNIADIEAEDKKIIDARRAKYEKFKPIEPPEPVKDKTQDQQENTQAQQENIQNVDNNTQEPQENEQEQNNGKDKSNVPINKGKKQNISLKCIGELALKGLGGIVKLAVDMTGQLVEVVKAVYEKFK